MRGRRPVSTGDEQMKKEILIGTLIALLSALAYAVTSVLVRQKVTQTPPLVGAAISVLSGTIVLGAMAAVRREPGLARKKRGIWYFLLAGTLMGLGVATSFVSLSLAPVVMVVPVQSIYPLFTLIFSRLFLGHLERITGQVVLGTILLVVGIVLIAIGRVS